MTREHRMTDRLYMKHHYNAIEVIARGRELILTTLEIAE